MQWKSMREAYSAGFQSSSLILNALRLMHVRVVQIGFLMALGEKTLGYILLAISF